MVPLTLDKNHKQSLPIALWCCVATMQSDSYDEDGAAGIAPSHGIALDLPTAHDNPARPAIVSHLYDYERTTIRPESR